MNHVKIEVSGKEGMFRVEKSVSLFIGHTTKSTVKETIVALKKEVKKLSTGENVLIDLSTMDKDCRSTSVYRFIPERWYYQGAIQLDARKFNGYEFPENKLNFATEKDMNKYLWKQVEQFIYETMVDIPEEGDCWYVKNLNDEYVPEDVLEFID